MKRALMKLTVVIFTTIGLIAGTGLAANAARGYKATASATGCTVGATFTVRGDNTAGGPYYVMWDQVKGGDWSTNHLLTFTYNSTTNVSTAVDGEWTVPGSGTYKVTGYTLSTNLASTRLTVNCSTPI